MDYDRQRRIRQARRKKARRRRLFRKVSRFFTAVFIIFAIYFTLEKIIMPEFLGQDAGLEKPDFSGCPDSLVSLYKKNPETRGFVLNYPSEYGKEHDVDISNYKDAETVPLFMQWDPQWGYMDYGDNVVGLTGCGPICLSMAGYAVTKDDVTFRPDNVVRFAIENGYCVPGSGSKWSLISEGGEKLGLDVTEIPLDKARIAENLEAGNPIICIMGPGKFTTTGHFIVLSCMEDEKFRINDPNSHKNSERVWEYEEFQDQILDLWAVRD